MSADTALINNLAQSRVLVHELLESQKRLIGALSVGCELAKLDPHAQDLRWQEFSKICVKAIADAVKVP